MNTSQKGIDLIKQFEGFKPSPYECPAGKLTIGYGHVIDPNDPKQRTNISEQEAETILKADVKIAEGIVNNAVQVPLTQGQFDALVSLVYNWGGHYFRSSNGVKKLNAKDYNEAIEEFFSAEKGVVRVNGKVLIGLVNRRQAELNLWKDH